MSMPFRLRRASVISLYDQGAAYYHQDLGEFNLPYEAVRTAEIPDAVLLDFVQSTYEAMAELAGWDRKNLERESHLAG